MPPNKNSLAIDSDLLHQARNLDIDVAAVAERALFHEIRRRRTGAEQQESDKKWKEENADSIAWSNRYLEEHGFPFPQYRRY